MVWTAGMDATQVVRRVERIAAAAWDYEAAHGLQDQLHVDVLTVIARESTDERAQALAQGALASTVIQFQRLGA